MQAGRSKETPTRRKRDRGKWEECTDTCFALIWPSRWLGVNHQESINQFHIRPIPYPCPSNKVTSSTQSRGLSRIRAQELGCPSMTATQKLILPKQAQVIEACDNVTESDVALRRGQRRRQSTGVLASVISPSSLAPGIFSNPKRHRLCFSTS